MKGRAGLVAAACVALALLAAASAVAARRQRELELSPIPTVENGAPRGLAAARAWLEATGRPFRVLRGGQPGPDPGDVVLLVSPLGELGEGEAAALVSHAKGGGVLVWAMGATGQPALERLLGVSQAVAPSDLVAWAAPALAPHPVFDGIVLRTGGAALRARGALPVAGARDRTSAAVIGLGAGEAIVLAGPEPLENFRLADGDNLALLSRLSAMGRIAFDERHLSRGREAGGARGRSTALVLLQALLATGVLLAAIGRRLGAVRGRAGLPGRSVRDYLASLGDLYGRARAERELCGSTWSALRRDLERRFAIPARLPDEEVTPRLAARSPEAAAAWERGRLALREPPSVAAFVELSRIAGELDAALAGGGRTHGGHLAGPRGRSTGDVVDSKDGG